MNNTLSMYRNGEWIFSDSGKEIACFNPYNGETLATLVEPTPAEVESVVANAHETFVNRRLSPQQRFEILAGTAELLRERKRDIAVVIARECGKPIRDAETEVMRAVTTFQTSAEEAKRIHGYTEELIPPQGANFSLGITYREPVGVVCAITPFNFPLNLAAHKIAPAIAAGNTVVFKPSEQTSLTGRILVDLLTESGLPPGFLNMVVGTGAGVGEALLGDQRIQFYSFTGSSRVGEYIKSRAGMRRVALELGSNAPNIVHDDADLEMAAKMLVKAAFSYAGQVCISAQRIYVHTRVMEPFLEKFLGYTAQLKMGDPLLEDTDVGPVINETQAARIISWVEEAVSRGAKVLAGGQRKGTLVEPTLLVGAPADCKVMCEEVFGPVVNVHPYDDLDQLIERVNESKFGLQAGVFTSNLDTALFLARKCKVGGVNINNASISRADTMPYGGVRHSGVGREGPKFAIEEMTDLKVITFNTKR